ncbi:hypothetical protein [Massilia cavernae]|uniref:Lipoprotein n=1 Tax=Massilia cavernae TaxID=2320864 RepID=A0A418XTS2_9BURK|nr:hypothetical protein [Massilia cavernae]RJG16091.1 hypothetical protein D3872_11380 [Massilia cavernae]
MRRTWILLAPLLLAGCVKGSATHYISGNDHTLTVRVIQDYFWKKEVDVSVVAARWPDCQRQFKLGALPLAEMDIEVFSPGENVYSLRAGSRLWQFETQNCTMLPAPAPAALGEPVGLYTMVDGKMVFEKAAK